MIAYIYIRVSGKGQLDGDGPDRQRDKCAEFVERNGLKRFAEYFEQGVSGTVEGLDRPVFSHLLQQLDEMAECGEPRCVVVERADRLARDLMVSEILLSECRKRGVAVYAADRGQLIDMATNEGDPTQKLFRQILGALAEWEKSMTVAKLAAARKRIRDTTGRCEGVKPYGATDHEKIVLAYAQSLRGHSDAGSVAMNLNAAGYRARNGKPWTRFSVRNILKGKTKA